MTKKDDMTELLAELCQTCEEAEGAPLLHTCPYASEIYDDEETLCNCCEDCERECAMARRSGWWSVITSNG